mmetsp:Transcript_9903/g.20810  ORF Transcript_9903/g.20810 Transcript_9903/m.20810 type:complete len:1038 (-) Transcript_9903:291-3404(-)
MKTSMPQSCSMHRVCMTKCKTCDSRRLISFIPFLCFLGQKLYNSKGNHCILIRANGTQSNRESMQLTRRSRCSSRSSGSFLPLPFGLLPQRLPPRLLLIPIPGSIHLSQLPVLLLLLFGKFPPSFSDRLGEGGEGNFSVCAAMQAFPSRFVEALLHEFLGECLHVAFRGESGCGRVVVGFFFLGIWCLVIVIVIVVVGFVVTVGGIVLDGFVVVGIVFIGGLGSIWRRVFHVGISFVAILLPFLLDHRVRFLVRRRRRRSRIFVRIVPVAFVVVIAFVMVFSIAILVGISIPIVSLMFLENNLPHLRKEDVVRRKRPTRRAQFLDRLDDHFRRRRFDGGTIGRDLRFVIGFGRSVATASRLRMTMRRSRGRVVSKSGGAEEVSVPHGQMFVVHRWARVGVGMIGMHGVHGRVGMIGVHHHHVPWCIHHRHAHSMELRIVGGWMKLMRVVRRRRIIVVAHVVVTLGEVVGVVAVAVIPSAFAVVMDIVGRRLVISVVGIVPPSRIPFVLRRVRSVVHIAVFAGRGGTIAVSANSGGGRRSGGFPDRGSLSLQMRLGSRHQEVVACVVVGAAGVSVGRRRGTAFGFVEGGSHDSVGRSSAFFRSGDISRSRRRRRAVIGGVGSGRTDGISIHHHLPHLEPHEIFLQSLRFFRGQHLRRVSSGREVVDAFGFVGVLVGRRTAGGRPSSVSLMGHSRVRSVHSSGRRPAIGRVLVIEVASSSSSSSSFRNVSRTSAPSRNVVPFLSTGAARVAIDVFAISRRGIRVQARTGRIPPSSHGPPSAQRSHGAAMVHGTRSTVGRMTHAGVSVGGVGRTSSSCSSVGTPCSCSCCHCRVRAHAHGSSSSCSRSGHGTSSSHVHVHIHIHVHAPHGGHAPDAQIERAAMRMNHPARHAGALIRMVGMRMTGVSPPSRISIAVVRPARGVEISSGILVVVLVVDGIGIHGVMDPSGGTGSSSSAGASVRRAIPMTISNLVVAGDGPAAAASPPAPRWQGEVVVVSVVEVAAVGIGIGMRTIVHCRWGWHDLDVLLSCMLVDGNIQTE